MSDALAMCGFESGRDLHRHAQRVVRGQRSAQRFTLQVFEHQVAVAFVSADVVERANVGMIDRRNRARFDLKPFGKLAGQQFHRDNTAEPRISGLVHLAHTARTDGCQDLIGAQSGSGSKGHKECRPILAYPRSGSRNCHSMR